MWHNFCSGVSRCAICALSEIRSLNAGRRSCKTLALRRQQLSPAHLRKVRREEFPFIQRRLQSTTDWTLLDFLHVGNLGELAKVHILTQPDALECTGMNIVKKIRTRHLHGSLGTWRGCLQFQHPAQGLQAVKTTRAATLAVALSADFSLGCTSQCRAQN